MIRYDLHCSNGHTFDGWFRDSAAFDDQAATGDVTCPACGDASVTKQLMAPAVPVRANRRADPAPAPVHATLRDERTRVLVEAIRELRQHVEANAEYVGDKFADEARKIHYEESEQRGIYGEASLEDARALLDEGVMITPLPRLPDERN